LQTIASVKNATKARFLYMLSVFEAVPLRSWKSRSAKQRFDRLTRWNGPLPAGCLILAFGAAPPLSAVRGKAAMASCNANVRLSILVLQKYHAGTHLWGIWQKCHRQSVVALLEGKHALEVRICIGRIMNRLACRSQRHLWPRHQIAAAGDMPVNA